MVLSAVQSVEVAGNTVGFVGVDVLLDNLPQLMEAHHLGNDGYAFLLSKDGTFLYHPDKEIANTNLTELPAEAGKLGEKMINGESGLQLLPVNERNEYIGYSPVTTTNWSVGTSLPESEALASLETFSMQMLLYFAISCILLICIVYFVASYMLKPIPKMMSVLKQLASGDLTPRLHIQSKDEM
ncbi:methyl-accepting chemotaxis protein, partial [Bacillaceae bacterium SIJ1]|uniref:cache domain-containing protein n=1 Tax=Litoribacterium kuwaitense TaxID=1398745 RepID=UPI0013ED198D